MHIEKRRKKTNGGCEYINYISVWKGQMTLGSPISVCCCIASPLGGKGASNSLLALSEGLPWDKSDSNWRNITYTQLQFTLVI